MTPQCAFFVEQWDYDLRSRLLARRRQLRMTQADVGKRLGVTRTFISHLESGRHGVMRLTRIADWAAVLDVAVTVHIKDGQIDVQITELA